MKTFYIETKNNQVIHDFSFHLIEAINYNNWYNNEKVYQYTTNSKYKDYIELIPIGSIEFVLEYLEKYHNIKDYKPLNIPEQLMKPEYLKRWVEKIRTNYPISTQETVFIKDNIKIKSYCGLIYKNENYPIGEWLVSEVINIKSEWRAFVFNNKLVGLKNYSGDFTLFPDIGLINKMILDFNYESAYTLDVGINESGTFIIECHDFFSCGLYGFADYIALPRMFISTWNKLIGGK